MLQAVTKTITTDESGDAKDYLGSRLHGRVHAIKIEPGSLESLAAVQIKGETTLVHILEYAGIGVQTLWVYPRARINSSLDGSAATDAFTDIHVLNERIEVTIIGGGDKKTGTITAYIDTPSPY